MLINYAGREINAKIVYYGPGLSGKTTNLECIYASVPSTSRGKMVSMKTRQDRTLFFDFLPLELGEVHGFRTRFLLYTVPGQVFYNATRKLVLKGADAVVFVADSGLGKMPENLEALHNLEENLHEQGLALESLPFVIQYNKRDLPQLHGVEELETALNPRRVPSFEAAAATGKGVYETLHAVSRLLFQRLMSDLRPAGSRPGVAPTAGVPAAPTAGAPRGGAPLGDGGSGVRPTAPPRIAGIAPGTQRPIGPRPEALPPAANGGGVGVQARPTAQARPAPPELVEPSPWQEGMAEQQVGLEVPPSRVLWPRTEPDLPPAAGELGEVRPPLVGEREPLLSVPDEVADRGPARSSDSALRASPGSSSEYSQYGRVVDLMHADQEPRSEPSGGGFIKDPLRRAEKPVGVPGRGGAPTARPIRTQYLSVVLSQAELRPGGTIRIVLDLQVEP